MAATFAVRQFNTNDGANDLSVSIVSVNGPVCLILSLTLLLLNPNWVRMKAGVLSRRPARGSENTTSSAVKALPDANFSPGFKSKLNVLPSGETVQPLATSP